MRVNVDLLGLTIDIGIVQILHVLIYYYSYLLWHNFFDCNIQWFDAFYD